MILGAVRASWAFIDIVGGEPGPATARAVGSVRLAIIASLVADACAVIDLTGTSGVFDTPAVISLIPGIPIRSTAAADGFHRHARRGVHPPYRSAQLPPSASPLPFALRAITPRAARSHPGSTSIGVPLARIAAS